MEHFLAAQDEHEIEESGSPSRSQWMKVTLMFKDHFSWVPFMCKTLKMLLSCVFCSIASTSFNSWFWKGLNQTFSQRFLIFSEDNVKIWSWHKSLIIKTSMVSPAHLFFYFLNVSFSHSFQPDCSFPSLLSSQFLTCTSPGPPNRSKGGELDPQCILTS